MQETDWSWTAIFFTAKNGHIQIDVFQSLLSYGARTEIKKKTEQISPLMHSFKVFYYELCRRLSVIDVASHLKQMHILSAMATSVDCIPVRKESETEINIIHAEVILFLRFILLWQKVDKKVRVMDSFILALEKRLKLAIGGLKM